MKSFNYKFILSFFICMTALTFSYAITVDEILNKAKQESSTYIDMLNDAKNYDYNAELLNYDDEISYKFGINSYLENENANDNSLIYMSPFFSYVNDNDNRSELSFNMPMNIFYKTNNDLSNSYNPNISYKQKISLDGVGNNLKKYSKQKALLQAESYRKRIDLEFENYVLTIISSILKKTADYNVLKSNYNLLEIEFNTLVDNSFLREGTYSYNTKYNALLDAKNNTESAKQSLENEEKEFKRICGFNYENIEISEITDIKYITQNDFNYKVYNAYLDKEIAENEYNMLAKNNSKAMNISLDADVNINEKEIENYDFSLHAGYTDDSFQVEVFSDIKIDNTLNKTYPKAGINLSYNIGKVKNVTDRINIEKSLINFQNKLFDYNNALIDYKNDIKDMNDRISIAKTNIEKEKNTFENAKINYENDIELYNNAYYSDDEFDLKKSEYLKAKNYYYSFLLDLMILERENKIINI